MLLDELNRTFSDVVYPGDRALADSYPSEWESTLRKLRGKSWQRVTFEDFDSQGIAEDGCTFCQPTKFPGAVFFIDEGS